MTDDRWWRDNGPATIFPKPVPIPSALIDDAPRYSLCINSEWMMYLLGCAKLLRRPETWQGTETEIEDAITQAQGLFAMVTEECVSGIQFQTPDPCTLQVSFDGGSTWETIYDGSACITAKLNDGTLEPGQKAPVLGPPVPSICDQYELNVPANGSTPLPFLLNAGDTVSFISGATNVWSDDVFALTVASGAFCGDGTIWEGPITGCGAGEAAHAGDPLGTANHMRVILQVNGVFYDFMGGTVTIPGGVVDAQGYLLPNDGNLSDNVGYQFLTVEVCYNAPAVTVTLLGGTGGPTSWQVGQTKLFTSNAAGCNGITFTLNHCADFEMVAVTGWSASGGSCAGSLLPGCGAWGGAVVQSAFVGKTYVDSDRMDMNSGSAWSVQLKLTHVYP